MAQPLIDGDPQRLGRYWLAGRLGSGGQGIVYEAYDADGTRVAIKMLRGDPAADRELRERMDREVSAARRVASFCTARVLDADLTGARPYIVSEYVEGPTLRGAVTAGRRFAGDELHRLAVAIATALTAIHEAGVVHRDLKPDNVLLGPDGPRVIDFGIARTLETTITSTGIANGTPTYMAPEVFTGQRAGMPADVFAWGAVVLFAATGEDPFRGESLGAVMHRVLSLDPDLSVLPGSLRELVGAALAKDPAVRPTAQELLLALVSGDGKLDIAKLLGEGRRRAGEMSAPAADEPALGTIAEDSYATLSPAERKLVPEVFLRLVTVTPDGELSLCRVPREDLLAGRPPEEAASLARVLAAFSYLITDGEEVGLSRPALPHAWPRLRSWIRTNRNGLAVYGRIAEAARYWHARGRRDADLLQGGSLDDALRWAATERRDITLTPIEREFLEAGAALTRRRARRNRVVSAVMAVLLAVALTAGGLAVRQSAIAAAQRDEADARRIAAIADDLRASDPAQAMLLSVAAWRLAPVPEARTALTGSLAQPEISVFRDPAARAARALSGDGRLMVSVSDDEARLWDVRTGARVGGVAKLGTGGRRVLGVTLSPSGRVLAVATTKEIRLWDVRTGRALPHRYPLSAGAVEFDLTFRFEQHEDLMMITIGQGSDVWNVRTGELMEVPDCCRPIPIPGENAVVLSSLKNGSVDRLSLPDFRRTRIGERCDCHTELAVTPDGGTLALGRDEAISFVDSTTGKEIGSSWAGGSYEGWNGGELRFSPDGTLLASVGDGSVQIYRTAFVQHRTIEEEYPLVMEHRIASTSSSMLRFDGDGKVLRYLDGDSVVSLDIAHLQDRDAEWIAVSPDARLLAGRDRRSGALLLSAPGGDGAGRVTMPGIKIERRHQADLAFNRDGTLLAVTSHDHDSDEFRIKIDVVDIASRTVRRTVLLDIANPLDAMAFSPDSRRLVIAGEGRVMMWDLTRGRMLWDRKREVENAREPGLAFTPDGSVILRDGVTGEVVIFDGDTGEPADSPVGAAEQVVDMAADGTLFILGDAPGRLRVWRPGSAAPRDLTLDGSLRTVTKVTFSADGRLLAAADTDGTVNVWDAATGRQVGRPDTEHVQKIVALAFSTDGSRLFVLDGTGDQRSYPLGPDALVAAVCARAGRDLSAEEWRTHLPERDQTPVCGS